MALPYKSLAPQDVLEAYYSNVQRSATIHMVMLDADGFVVAANRATARLFGKTPDELVGLNWIELAIPKPRQEEARSVFLRLLATGLPEVNEGPILIPDGTTRVLLWSNSLMHAGDKLTGVVSFGIDISEQSRIHAELQHERQMLMRAEVIAGLGTYVLSTDTGTWTSSAVLDRIFGITDVYPRTVQGWLDIVHPDDRGSMADYFNSHVLVQHQTFDRTYRIVRKSDGQTRIVHGFGELELGPNGKVLRMLGTIQDITEQAHISEELLESEARFRELVQHSPDAIVILDAETGRFLEANPQAESLFGMSRDEILKIGPADVSPPTQPDGRPSDVAARDFIRLALNSGEQTFNWMHRTKQGTEKLCVIRLLRLPSREHKLLRGSMLDITESQKEQAKLELAEKRFRLAAQHAHMLVYDWDIPGGDLAWEGAVQELTGYTPDTFPAATIAGWSEMIHPDDRATALELLDTARQKRTPYSAIYRLRCSDGHYITVEDNGSFILDDAGATSRMIGTMRNLTQVRESEQKLRESENLYRSLVENLPDAVGIIAPDGTFRYVNGRGLQMMGATSPEQVLGRPAMDFIAPDARPTSTKRVEAAAAGASNAPIQTRFMRLDGTVYDVEVRSFPVTIHGERVILAVTRDLSDIKEVESRLSSLFQSMNDGFVEFGAVRDTSGRLVDLKYLATNPAHDVMVGHTGSELVGKQLYQVFPAVDKVWLERYGTVLSSGVSASWDNESKVVSGRSWRTRAWRSGKDRLAVLFTDNTEQVHKQAEMAHLSEVVNNMSEAFAEHTMIFDAKGVPVDYQFTSVNPAFEQVTGLHAKDIIGKSVRQVLPDTEPQWIQRYAEVVQTGTPATFVSESKAVGSKSFRVHAWRSAPGRFAVIFYDVTKQQRQIEGITAILDNAIDTIAIITPDGTCKYQNAASEKMLGYKPEELEGKNLLSFVHPDDLEQTRQQIARGIADPTRPYSAVYRFKHKNGTWRYLESTGASLLDNPNIGGILIFSRDITDIKKGQAAMVRVDELEEMNKAMIGRELRIAELKAEIAKLKEQLGAK